MLKTISVALLPLLMFFGSGLEFFLPGTDGAKAAKNDTGAQEKMIVANGSVAIDLDLAGSGRANSGKTGSGALKFEFERDSFFTVLVFKNELRGAIPSTAKLIPQSYPELPGKLGTSFQTLALQRTEWGSDYEFAIIDAKTGFTFFNIEGAQLEYDAATRELSLPSGRVLLSKEFAADLGRPQESGRVVGNISISANMRTIEVAQIVNGETTSVSMPNVRRDDALAVPGPDVIVGDVNGLAQFGSAAGGFVGLALGTDSCNNGTVDLNWFALPVNDHPVIPQNMYRMSGGATNDERFEQIGQSSVKHAFTALAQNLCGFGCNGTSGEKLGVGCSDPYSAGLNSGPNLGSRAWINPFSGAYPRGDSTTNPNSHTGHAHTGTSHRILTSIEDLNTAMNTGATYYAEGQYVTPHEYAWCQANPGQCNMYNNVSYRRYNVTGTSSFSFSPVGATVRTKAAVTAWTGSTAVQLEPAPGQDGIGIIAYKVTNPSAGVWHYEYAIYNQNMDRAIQAFSVPVGNGATLSNIGFHAPPQHPGWGADGTTGNSGFSSTPWVSTQSGGALNWATETFAANQNANAIRWGTLYNFRFDSNQPPQTVNATIGFFKTGAPITVQVQGPSGSAASSFALGGQVNNGAGRGVANARVLISSGSNVVASAVTGPFGYYQVNGLASGSYTVTVSSKRHSYAPRTVSLSDNVTGFDFTPAP